jgi:Ni/Co efflux regulator RcnB
MQRAERAERQVERSGNVERADRTGSADRPQRAERGERQARPGRVNRDTPVAQQVQAPQPIQSEQQVQRNRRPDGLADGFAQVGRDLADGRANDRDRDRDRDWSRDWRKDRRYDWSNHRHRYGSLYRLGRYYDPYGWGYRRFSIGFNIWPSYYGSNYWLNDPWMYRLPPAYGPFRWVRYYDDAILVNVYTGFVVDVIHNFFW